MASAADLLSPAQTIPTKSVAIDIASTDHNLAVVADGKAILAPFARRLYIGTAGNVVLRLAGDSTDRTYKVAAGTYLTGAIVKITRALTTAADMVAEQ